MSMPRIIKETPAPWNGRRVTAYALPDGSTGVEVTRWKSDYSGYGCPWIITHSRTFPPAPAPHTLQAHTGDTCRIVTHDARWSACPPCNQWIDTTPAPSSLTPATR